MPTQPSQHRSEGGRLVTVDGRQLPLVAVEVRAEAGGGIARVTLVQHFQNPYPEPLHVTYQMPLPQDGAVAGYAFRIGEKRVVGEVDRLRQARERFERALVEGKTAALLSQDRANLFTQELGNVPPGERIAIELSVDQRLRWLSEGMWEWRFPTVVPPRYLGEEGRVSDAERVTVEVADGPTGAAVTFELGILDPLSTGRTPESPSHRLAFGTSAGRTSARLEEGTPLDRDLVVRWAVAAPEPGATVIAARPSLSTSAAEATYALLTVVPPVSAPKRIARDLIVLIDVSGSMCGPPMERSKQVVAQLIETLEERDTLELISFGDRPVRWKRSAVAADTSARSAAIRWVKALEAGGATEMKSGVEEALRPLKGGGQRQVLLVTDGHIGFEEEIVRELTENLPKGSRLHAIGVGSSVNRALTGAAARAGRGVEIIVDLDEDAERGASRLVAATRAPVLVDLGLEGEGLLDVAPRNVPDLMAGAPVLLSVKVKPEGGTFTLRGSTADGAWTRTVKVPACSHGEGLASIAALYAREKVEDLEMQLAGGESRSDVDPQIERLGLTHQIATRLTAWVAVTDEATVDPTEPTRRESVPQKLPYGMSVTGLGLRPATLGQATAMGQAMSLGRRTAQPSPAPPLRNMSAPLAPSSMEVERAMRPPAKRMKELARDDVDERREEEASKEAASEARAPWQKPKGAFAGLADRMRGALKKALTVNLRGRTLASADGKTTIEIDVVSMEWDPDATFEAELADGQRVELNVDRGRSTRKTNLLPAPDARGPNVVRLTFDTIPAEVVAVYFVLQGTSYRVQL